MADGLLAVFCVKRNCELKRDKKSNFTSTVSLKIEIDVEITILATTILRCYVCNR